MTLITFNSLVVVQRGVYPSFPVAEEVLAPESTSDSCIGDKSVLIFVGSCVSRLRERVAVTGVATTAGVRAVEGFIA